MEENNLTGILATQYSGAILGPIAKVLGAILNVIFNLVPNVGWSIILFTLVIYIILLPLTYKQQKFSKLSARMNPEIQALREKYKNKRDQESMQRQNEEMQEIYKKYGVSTTGSCVQLLIQMPILFALYRVIYNIPAYVKTVYEHLEPLANNIISTVSGIPTISQLEVTTKNFAKYAEKGNFEGSTAVQSVIDVLNRASSKEWDAIGAIPGLDINVFNSARSYFEDVNNFFGLNIANSPWYTIKESFDEGNYLLIVGALLIPVLAAVTQWLNVIFMPQPASAGDGSDSMQATMKSMNLMMPIMSAFFCFTLPCGLGLYWIAGAAIRCVEQVIINKHFDKMDIDALIAKNVEKYQAKKKVEDSKKVTSSASISTKALGSKSNMSQAEKDEALRKAKEYYDNNTDPNSITA
ncbi:MAG: YidC/Oxa1 family membrane protein insertase, partial [Lachnospiraceae bacterium]|nr:YidC/Oxa1 family membrane protein insertase [Lachnospiraceae bacterium]